jgi:class 3 adenylate cyclase
VTLLFCDVSGSTELGERMDAESVRDLMSEYFREMRNVIESHGGTIEKFIGDAIVAVFGMPEAHEDDALRAVSAANDMAERLEALNERFQMRFGSRLEHRIGVNTGEVMVGGPIGGDTFATGDTVNVAARLEQAATPGAILIGESTYRSVKGAVRVDPVGPIVAKAAHAGPSEIWVSQTVKDVVAGSGISFEDAGEHELKGVPDRWRLYRVLE